MIATVKRFDLFTGSVLIYFNHGTLHKAALFNKRVIWERDAAGPGGWEHIAVPVNFNVGPNELELRLYQTGTGSSPITVWWGDINIESAEALFALWDNGGPVAQ